MIDVSFTVTTFGPNSFGVWLCYWRWTFIDFMNSIFGHLDHSNSLLQFAARAGELSAPTLIADSLTATSLRLEWKGIDVKRFGNGILYFVQWQYEDFTETWQFCRNQSWREDDQILVYNLQSYTKYRVSLILFQYLNRKITNLSHSAWSK